LSRLIKKKEPANKPISVISGPTNVKHEVHLGWDPRDGFQIRNIPPEWKKLFAAAGTNTSHPNLAAFSLPLLSAISLRRCLHSLFARREEERPQGQGHGHVLDRNRGCPTTKPNAAA
jgi:hypothetical protein